MVSLSTMVFSIQREQPLEAKCRDLDLSAASFVRSVTPIHAFEKSPRNSKSRKQIETFVSDDEKP
jgi:hypothetical protein